MDIFLAEVIGTAVLLLLGNGVVANVSLNKTFGNNGGWIVITSAWGLAVFTAVFITAPYSGAHLNPAVTLGLAVAGKLAWGLVPTYMGAQFLGAAIGTSFAWLVYRQHFDITEDQGAKLGSFCTGPAINSPSNNLLTEIIATFMLVFGVFYIVAADITGSQGGTGHLGALDAIPVGFLVWVIGMALGGSTGYAINPARDLSPRIMHAILPIKGKGSSNWGYAWIPVVGPLLGAVLAGLAFGLL